MPKVLVALFRDLNCSGGGGGWSTLDVKKVLSSSKVCSILELQREAEEFPALQHQTEPKHIPHGQGASREAKSAVAGHGVPSGGLSSHSHWLNYCLHLYPLGNVVYAPEGPSP